MYMYFDTFILPAEPTRPVGEWSARAQKAWPPYFGGRPITTGETVFVRGTRYGSALATVLEPVVAADDDVLVQRRDAAARIERIPKRRLERCYGRSGRPAILLCEETSSFRKLARSQTQPSDAAFEIGCSFGASTKLLAAHAKSVYAVDMASEPLKQAAASCAGMHNVRFAKLDALLERERLLKAAVGADSLFVDINGNRAAATVSALLRLLLYERAATARPRVTVVKCRALCRAAEYFEDTTRTEGITMNDAPSNDHAGTAFTSGAGLARVNGDALMSRGAAFWRWIWDDAAAEVEWETRSMQRVQRP